MSGEAEASHGRLANGQEANFSQSRPSAARHLITDHIVSVPTNNRSRPHTLLEHLQNNVLVLMAEGGQTPRFEEELIMLAQPLAGLHEFFLEQAAIEAHLLEHLLAQLHHLPSLIHHHVSSFGGDPGGGFFKKPDEGKSNR